MEKKLYVAPETVMIEFDFEDRIAWSGCKISSFGYVDSYDEDCFK